MLFAHLCKHYNKNFLNYLYLLLASFEKSAVNLSSKVACDIELTSFVEVAALSYSPVRFTPVVGVTPGAHYRRLINLLHVIKSHPIGVRVLIFLYHIALWAAHNIFRVQRYNKKRTYAREGRKYLQKKIDFIYLIRCLALTQARLKVR